MNYKSVWNPSEIKQLKAYIAAGEADKAFALVKVSMYELLQVEDLSIYSIIDTLKMIEIVLNETVFHLSLIHIFNYKFEGNAPQHIKTELVECARMVSDLDARMLSLNEEILSLSGETED